MKKLVLALVALVAMLPMSAEEHINSLAMKVLVEDLVEPFPAGAKAQVEQKLTQLLTKNGIASSDYLGQFFITARAIPQQKEVVNGTPAQIVEIMDFAFYIADYANQVVFATTTVTSRGVGTNENKAYMDAIRHINLNNTALQKFVEDGRSKIVAYYDQQADKMMAKAASLATQHQYEEALYMLTTIPSECKKYEEALAMSDKVFQQYIDYLCDINLAQAKAAWAAKQNSEGAAEAGQYLANIYPDAKCYGDAETLYTEIKGKVLDDWHFEMKKWQDGVDLESQRINAAREVGVAYGNGQQPTTTNIGFLR